MDRRIVRSLICSLAVVSEGTGGNSVGQSLKITCSRCLVYGMTSQSQIYHISSVNSFIVLDCKKKEQVPENSSMFVRSKVPI